MFHTLATVKTFTKIICISCWQSGKC